MLILVRIKSKISELLPSIMERIYNVLSIDEASTDRLYATYQRSLFISADMAHSVHPNYVSKHQELHRVNLNKGVVLKINANNRYTTNALSGAMIRVIAKQAGVPLQEFIVRQDSPCGSTIGPMLSSKIGIKAIDVGVAQLSMHSIREICGAIDSFYYKEFFKAFYENPIPTLE